MIPYPISERIQELLSVDTGKEISIINSISLGGGCINDAVKLQTATGNFFLKYNRASTYPGMFAMEAAGLELLNGTRSIRIPRVISFDSAGNYSFLLLEYIEKGIPQPQFWEIFARTLASLHKHSNSLFGLESDNYIGSLPQSNKQHTDWITFFILQRLEPMVRLARDSGKISTTIAKRLESLYLILNRLIPVEIPSLLHGDLWNGNFLVDEKGFPCLFDPAVYYGHREADLAMTRLFGGFPPHFYESYHHAFPLIKGWEDRVDIFNLYPLLVHVNLFGGGYMADVERIISHY